MDITRAQKATLLMTAGLGLTAFAVYASTLHPETPPGTQAGHPLWLALSQAVGAGSPFRPALFSAICGAATVALLCGVAERLFGALIRQEHDLRVVPNDGAEESPPEERGGETCRLLATTFGGVFCALTFAFCAPFWRASVSPSVHAFDMLSLVLFAALLLRCHTSGGRDVCLATMFLCGAGVVESPVFLLVALVALAVVIRVIVQSDYVSEQVLPQCLLAGAAGIAANLGLGLVQQAGAGAEGLTEAARELVGMYRAVFPQDARPAEWFFIWIIPTATLLLSVVSVRAVSSREEGTGVAGWALIAALTGIVLANMLALPHTVWTVAREGRHLPILPSLMVALAAGCLFVCWFHAAVIRGADDEYEIAPSTKPMRVIGFAVCGLMVIALLRQPCIVAEGMSGGQKATGWSEASRYFRSEPNVCALGL
jgi:hypothetical protein